MLSAFTRILRRCLRTIDPKMRQNLTPFRLVASFSTPRKAIETQIISWNQEGEVHMYIYVGWQKMLQRFKCFTNSAAEEKI